MKDDPALQLVRARQAISLAAAERERLLHALRQSKQENHRLRMLLTFTRRDREDVDASEEEDR
jgi:hypothetical protein